MAQVESILANLYSRQFSVARLSDWATLADFNEIYVSADDGRTNDFHNNNTWGWNGTYGFWGTWDYGYIRELNLFIERMPQATIPENLISTLHRRGPLPARRVLLRTGKAVRRSAHHSGAAHLRLQR